MGFLNGEQRWKNRWLPDPYIQEMFIKQSLLLTTYIPVGEYIKNLNPKSALKSKHQRVTNGHFFIANLFLSAVDFATESKKQRLLP